MPHPPTRPTPGARHRISIEISNTYTPTWRRDALLLTALTLGLGGAACEPAGARLRPEPALAPPDAPAPARETHATPAPELPVGVLPAPIEEAPDDTARVLACLEYNHIDLLNQTDKRDQRAVAARLGELRVAGPVCRPLVKRALGDFGPFLTSFEREWDFYEAYFGLTMEAYAVHNRQAFCQRYAATVEATREALDATRAYEGWLAAQLAGRREIDPYVLTMHRRARDKVSALTVVDQKLGTQYRRECRP